jgi:hypothetical protein
MGHYQKLPHQYAKEFIGARGDAEKQRSIIRSAPKGWLQLIKKHINNYDEWSEHESKQLQSNGAAADRKRGTVDGNSSRSRTVSG